jgi:phenylalanyl-tRNA synthetase beta chain
VSVNGARLGTLAELHPDVREALDLGRAVVALEFGIAPLLAAVRLPEGRAPGRFPTMRRDVALLVPRSAPAGNIAETLRSAAGALCERVEIFDRYAGKGIAEGHQSLAFALYFRSDERTLKDEEVDAWTKSALAAATEAFGATQR